MDESLKPAIPGAEAFRSTNAPTYKAYHRKPSTLEGTARGALAAIALLGAGLACKFGPVTPTTDEQTQTALAPTVHAFETVKANPDLEATVIQEAIGTMEAFDMKTMAAVGTGLSHTATAQSGQTPAPSP